MTSINVNETKMPVMSQDHQTKTWTGIRIPFSWLLSLQIVVSRGFLYVVDMAVDEQEMRHDEMSSTLLLIVASFLLI